MFRMYVKVLEKTDNNLRIEFCLGKKRTQQVIIPKADGMTIVVLSSGKLYGCNETKKPPVGAYCAQYDGDLLYLWKHGVTHELEIEAYPPDRLLEGKTIMID